MRKRAVRFTIYLIGTMAAFFLILFAGITYQVNGWVVFALLAASFLPLVWFIVSPYLTPGWIKQIQVNGTPAKALVLEEDIMQGTGYQGSDMWIDLRVEVKPQNEESFKSQVKIRLSQAVFGLPITGEKISVRFDPNDHSRVVLDGDLVKLQSTRAREPK